ncbi:unnamed protein product [Paramecium sonneborni]|uniref:Uncharacterized protein n=1 Tax=Paramecium sonneborni TaxID=65129 RepID=A0A8S1KEM9_9CILI|nr:unnamed protein product [Paramecium sonneborni]
MQIDQTTQFSAQTCIIKQSSLNKLFIQFCLKKKSIFDKLNYSQQYIKHSASLQNLRITTNQNYNNSFLIIIIYEDYISHYNLCIEVGRISQKFIFQSYRVKYIWSDVLKD